jgi:hypothetical protein
MSADLLSNFLGMTLQGTGNNNNAWGTIMNGSALLPLERAVAGNISHEVTGGMFDLSGSTPPSGQTQPLAMLQVFTGALRYPDSPGFKSRGTSSLAARRIEPHAQALRDRVLALLKVNYPAAFTADEVADRFWVSILSARPRLSELRRSALIEPTAERRKNMSGMMARCWRAVLRDARNERAQ